MMIFDRQHITLLTSLASSEYVEIGSAEGESTYLPFESQRLIKSMPHVKSQSSGQCRLPLCELSVKLLGAVWVHLCPLASTRTVQISQDVSDYFGKGNNRQEVVTW